MTLIFDRTQSVQGKPKTHACVIGVGRFPHLEKTQERASCAYSAGKVVEFLVKHKDHFEAPLATIECLLSDPAVDARTGHDVVEHADTGSDPRDGVAWVDPATSKHIKQACKDWASRCNPNDVLFLYCTSHGFSIDGVQGLLALEDYNEDPKWPSMNLLDVGSIMHNTPAATGAGSVWVFMDACQLLDARVEESLRKEPPIRPIQYTRDQLVELAGSLRCTGMISSVLDQEARVPSDGGLAHFTEAMLEGLKTSCVEMTPSGWMVTASAIGWGLERLAWVKFKQKIKVDKYKVAEPFHRLLRVDDPRVHVAVQTVPEHTMSVARRVEIYPRKPHPRDRLAYRDDANLVWRCSLKPVPRELIVELEPESRNMIVREFDLIAPAMEVVIDPRT